MKRIYIDTNTFSQMRSGTTEKFVELKTILEKNKNSYFYLFSRAHIDDLQNDKTDHRADSLNFIESFCSNYFLSYDHLYHKLNLYHATPSQVDADLQNNTEATDFTNLFSAFDDIESPEIKAQVDILKAMFASPTFTFFADENKLRPQDRTQLLKVVPEINAPVSLNDFFIKSQELYKELNDKKSFKDFRRYNLENLPFSNIHNIDLKTVNDALKTSPLKKDLNELIDQQNQSDKNATFNQQISHGFILLNFFGLDKEKNKKADFTALTNDSQHAFYAAYCDIIVTEDEGLRTKAKILYENYNIPTKVFSVEEFIDFHKRKSADQITCVADFLNSLNNQINPDNFSHQFDSTQFNRKTTYFNPTFAYFDYFNLIEFIDDVDTGRAIVLAPNRDLSFFWEELKLILNKIVACFGIDLLQKGDLSDDDINKIEEGAWEGRLWGIAGIAVSLEVNVGTKKLSLVVNKIPDPEKFEEQNLISSKNE